MINVNPVERHQLSEQYQVLFVKTLRIEQQAQRRGLNPSQSDSHDPQLCRELESVTLKLSRLSGDSLAKVTRP
jgi:uncharacterized phage-associated protein